MYTAIVSSAMRATEKCSRARWSPASPSARARLRSDRSSTKASPIPLDVARLEQEPCLPRPDDLGHGADAGCDDRERGQHRLQQHESEALPQRRVGEHVSPFQPVADLEPAREEDGALEPERGDECARLILERPDAQNGEDRLGMPAPCQRERAEQRRVILLLRQPSDGEDQRGGVRQSEVGGLCLRRLGREVVQPVAHGDELFAGKAGLLEKRSDRVRDGDDATGGSREEVVDVAERAEQVAVVVVPRGDERQPEGPRCHRSVDIPVDEVRVQQIGFRGSSGADHGERHAGIHVGAAADTREGDSTLLEHGIEAWRVTARNVEAEEARVDATLAQCRQQGEEMALRPADSGDLVQVQDLHAAPRRCAYNVPILSTMCGMANRTRTSAAPREPSSRASSGSRAMAVM